MIKSTLILMALLFSQAIFSQSPKGTFVGTVIDQDENNAPLPFAHVLVCQNDSIIYSGKTDFDGLFKISNIALGSYEVVVRAPAKIDQKDTLTFTEQKTILRNYELANSFKVLTKVADNRKMKSSGDEDAGCAVQRISGVSLVRKMKETKEFDGTSNSNLFGFNKNSREKYDLIVENDFKAVQRAPLSTFSIDVDKAAYANVRRYIREGNLPPTDAIRIEEMINYFNYNYAPPVDDSPIAIHTEYTQCPWDTTHQIVHIGLKAKEINMQDAAANNLVFLIDVSGSMGSEDKLGLVKNGLELLVDKMRKEDRIAIVVYAGASGVVLPSTSGKNKEKIIEALDKLYSGGSTAGGSGIQLAYEIAKKNFKENGNNRIILATDGDFNVGMTSNSELIKLIERKRESNISLSVLGVGRGNLNDGLMEQLADKGNGNYNYLDNILEAKKVLIKELGGTLITLAKDVKTQVEFNPKFVTEYRLIGYENRLLNDEDFNDDTKDAGELGSGHTVTIMYELIPPGISKSRSSIDPLKYQKEITSNELSNKEILTVKFRYKNPKENKSKLISKIVKADDYKLYENTSDDCRFAMAVASFGMVLRESPNKGNSNFNDIISLAQNAKGKDNDGYRAEFIQLVEMAELKLTFNNKLLSKPSKRKI